MANSKGRGILFVADMVNAILRKRKTQTRRIIGGHFHSQPVFLKEAGLWSYIEHDGSGEPAHWIDENFEPIRERLIQTCPYGKPGDILWVRETWATEQRWNDTAPGAIRNTAPIWYLADGPGPDSGWTGKTRSSLHLPRWGARIRLEITEIRVEQVQDITEEDARAEGVNALLRYVGAYRDEFISLWDKINGERTGCRWDDNPWVWVVTFKVLSTERTLETIGGTTNAH